MKWLVVLAILSSQARANIIEGDIAVEDGLSLSTARNSFIRDPSSLWSNARVHYTFDSDKGGDILREDQKAIITEVLDYFEKEVPCLQFM